MPHPNNPYANAVPPTPEVPNSVPQEIYNPLGVLPFKEWWIATVYEEDNKIKWTMQDMDEIIDNIFRELDYPGIHMGECIKEPQSCLMCHFEDRLNQYFQYTREIAYGKFRSEENESDEKV